MKVFGVSCITNMATGIATVKHSHEEVVRVANEASEKLCAWMKEFIVNI
jgi:purine-nucleoside phosphorylase